MSQGVILGLALAAGLTCPLHMWWSHRGRAAGCARVGSASADDQLETLRVRQAHLTVLVAQHAQESAAPTGDVFSPAVDHRL